jgi:hypothetical protein
MYASTQYINIISINQKLMCTIQFQAIILYCKNIQHVLIEWKRGHNKYKIEELMSALPRIKCLDVKVPGSKFNTDFAQFYSKFNNDSTLTMLNKWRSHLNLDESTPSVSCLPPSEEDIQQMIIMRMQNLETSGIACTLTSNILRTICTHRTLKYLLVANEHLGTSTAIDIYPMTAVNNLESLQLQCIHKSISSFHISKVVAQFPHLVKLEIVGGGGALSGLTSLSTKLWYLNPQESQFGDENLIHISLCKSLIHLDIANNIHVTDKCIEYVAYGCNRLQFLDVSYCEKMTDNIVNILHMCTDLQSLRMNGFTFEEKHFSNILILFPYLKEISGKDNGVSWITEYLAMKMQNLKILL